MSGWDDSLRPDLPPITAMGYLRVVLRAVPIGLVVFGGLAVLLLLRLIERPVFGARRRVTPWITQGVCRTVLWIMGFRVAVQGTPLRDRGAMVANHTSWLDIFVLNAQTNLYFVSKAEVAGWPGIGWLARATGTVFINRDRREAAQQTALFQQRLMQGHRLLFFPEGTSTDGLRVLPFKTTLFAAFLTDELRHALHLQAVSAVYHAPPGQEPRFYGWWGDMEFAPSLVQVMAQAPQGRVNLIYHDPLRVDDHPNRKTLAAHLEEQVRAAHDTARASGGGHD